MNAHCFIITVNIQNIIINAIHKKHIFSGSDLKHEIRMLVAGMHQKYNVEKQPTIYDPKEFEAFCIQSGAYTIYQNLCRAMNDKRHSEERDARNRYVAMTVLYELCYGKSQRCNALQKDHGIYLKMNHATQEALDTEKKIGNTVCSRTVENEIKRLADRNSECVNNAVDLARENGWLVVCIVDDYTTIHAKRRPTDTTTSQVNCMCTIVCRIFPQIPAIPLTSLGNLQNPRGVDIELLKTEFASPHVMHSLASSYCDIMPDWFSCQFFNPEAERHRLYAHMYSESENVRKLRCLDNLYLVDFLNQPLKSTANFESAIDVITSCKIGDYMKKYAVLMPGDWPAQYHMRKAVYRKCNYTQPIQKNPALGNQMKQDEEKHFHSYCSSFDSELSEKDSLNKDFDNCMQSAVPLIGPLHISLNSREDVMQNYHPFFKYMYELLFPKQKLADKPVPWRTSLILEIVYGGWTLIRSNVKKVFAECKHILYGILFTLLDSYLPLVLSIYSVIFRLNLFQLYYNSIIHVWVLFYCFHRHHYNKAPLVWLSNILFWKKNNTDLYKFMQQYLTTTDEYPVENVHSIIRAQTSDGDSIEMLQKKARAVFQSKKTQQNFRSNFTPPKNFTFSQNQLASLKLKCSEHLVHLFSKLSLLSAESKFNDSPLETMFEKLLQNKNCHPLGYHTDYPPSPVICCDMPGCTLLASEETWNRFDGCFHSFHVRCAREATHCPICRSHLKSTVANLAKTAQKSLFDVSAAEQDASGGYEEDADDSSKVFVDALATKDIEKKVDDLAEEIKSLKPCLPNQVCYCSKNDQDRRDTNIL